MAKTSHLSFKKDEKLCSKKIIEFLIKNGKIIVNQPFRLTWSFFILPEKVEAQILFVVPKKNFKSAVIRNRIRRQMREVYRLQKGKIIESLANHEKQVAIMLIYTGKKQLAWKEMESKIILILQRFEESIHACYQ